jgi:integrase/recombinase XerD
MTEQAISPLRRRMIEDMTIRKFAQKTQHDYVQRVKDFASYLKRSPDTAKPEDVRGFQLHLTSSGAGTPKINATVAALRFFFRVTLGRPDLRRTRRPRPATRSPPLTWPRRRSHLWPAHGQIPIAEPAAPPNTCPFPRFRPLKVFGRRPPCVGKRS